MSKKKIVIIVLACILIVTFSYGYYWGVNKYKHSKTKEKDQIINSTAVGISAVDEEKSIVKSNAVLVFKIEYKKANVLFVEKQEVASADLVGKDKDYLEQVYKDYKVDSIASKEVVLVKSMNSYEPNKYVRAIKESDGVVAIYKTDENGNYNENEPLITTDIKVERLKEGDIESLTRGSKDHQFDTREQAEGSLEDYE